MAFEQNFPAFCVLEFVNVVRCGNRGNLARAVSTEERGRQFPAASKNRIGLTEPICASKARTHCCEPRSSKPSSTQAPNPQMSGSPFFGTLSDMDPATSRSSVQKSKEMLQGRMSKSFEKSPWSTKRRAFFARRPSCTERSRGVTCWRKV